jgi:imidazolonepropionase-like amidohydrolase
MRGLRADIAFDGERVLSGGALVLIEGSTIVAVEPGTATAPAGCEVTYVPGTTLLPGLVDAHVHLCGDSTPDALHHPAGLSADELDAVVAASMQVELNAGVTAVRDLGDQDFVVADRHRRDELGPTVVASGPPITSVGGHCAQMGGAVAGPEELRRAVRDRAEHGVDVVKIMTSGGLMTAGTDVLACQFALDELRVVVDEAHRLGLPVTAHAHALAAVAQCVDAGVDGIEHCSCMTEDGLHTPPELADRIAAAGIVVCPTLGVAMLGVMPPEIKALTERTGIRLQDRVAQVGELIRAGVELVSGGDSGINPAKRHGVLPFSVSVLVDCGASPLQALASATSRAARACGLAGRTGMLQPGLDADLLVVDGDATADVGALHAVRTVVSRGREVQRSG